MHRQSVIRWGAAPNDMELTVTYDTKEPENYLVKNAYHNGKDITDFYHYCETRDECLLYPQIIEGIAREMCAERIAKRLIS